ncbi:MAG: hypothetical protein QGG14_07975, partial [Planctomycetota bacterium]|nr:hypothetical protein [Planctomycetota bacterium]
MQLRQTRAIFLALALGLCCLGKALVPGYALLPQDVRGFAPLTNALTEDERRAIDAATVPHRRDKVLQFLPYDTAVGESWARGEVPLWEPRMSCGMPLLAQATSRAFYPTAIAFALFNPAGVYAWSYLLHLVLAGLFAYRLARRLGATEAGSLFANGTLVLSSWASAHVHHPMIFFAALWILPALEASHALLRPGGATRILPMACLTICTCLSWLAGFAQASVLLGYLVLGFTALLLLEDRVAGRGVAWKPALLIPLGLGLGTTLAALQLAPTLELSQLASRTPATLEALRASALSPTHWLDLLLPSQLAAPGDMTPRGPDNPRPTWLSLLLVPMERRGPLSAGTFNHTETAVGMGAWALLFAIGALRRLRDEKVRVGVWFLGSASLLALLAAVATPGLIDIASLLPGARVGDFRRLLLVPALCLPILAGLGFREPNRSTRVATLVIGATIAGFALLLLTTGEADFATWAAGVQDRRWGLPAGTASENFASGELAANQALLVIGLGCLGAALVTGAAFGRRAPLLAFLVAG